MDPMRSLLCLGVVSVCALSFAVPAMTAPRVLNVCDDPNNLPFSNDKQEGFENKIVDLVAKDLGATVTYTWWAERRGFVRHTLKAGSCDLIPGIPSTMDMVRATAPYYRSTYVFVTRQDGPIIKSFDDPALRSLKVGVQIIGNDHFSTPPAHALARRGITENVRGFSVYGDYSQPNPPARILDAVVSREVDVAAVWGPLAGFFTKRDKLPLRLTPVSPMIDGPNLPMVFDISMGVRREDGVLLREVGATLARHRGEIAAILADYGVPGADLGSAAR
jgi:mxaJ protein